MTPILSQHNPIFLLNSSWEKHKRDADMAGEYPRPWKRQIQDELQK